MEGERAIRRLANSIRPGRLASHRWNGEAQTRDEREAHDADGQVTKRSWERLGDWRRSARKARHVKRRDLRGRKGTCASNREPRPPRRSQSTDSSGEAG